MQKVMHASFRVGESTILASDGRSQGGAKFQGFSLAIMPKTDDEGTKIFAALSDGGAVRMPLMKTFFASNFGMVSDRFGVLWTIVVSR